jgi:hypothetical protein
MDLFASSRMVQETSANGLRHVGYGVPIEMFPPFVSGAVMACPGSRGIWIRCGDEFHGKISEKSVSFYGKKWKIL